MKRYLAALSLLFIAGTGQTDTQGVSDSEIVVGAHTNESGFVALYASVPRAAAAYFDQVNEKGGVHGRKIRFVRVDSQGVPLKSVEATRKLVEEDRIFAMVAGQGQTHQAVYKYLIEKEIPDLFFSDYLSEYGQPLKKSIFPSGYSFEAEGASFGNYIVANLKGKRACFLMNENALGEETVNGTKAVIEKANLKLSDPEKITIGSVERVDRMAAQSDTQILKLKREKCDVVVNATSAGLCPNGITYGFKQGFKPVWLVEQVNAGPKFSSLIPEGIREGVISTTAFAVSEDFHVPGWKDFQTLMEQKGIPLSRAQTGYSQAEIFVETLKRAGKNLTRESLLKAAESMNGYKCSLCLAPITTTPTNHWMFSTANLIVIKGGKFVAL